MEIQQVLDLEESLIGITTDKRGWENPIKIDDEKK